MEYPSVRLCIVIVVSIASAFAQRPQATTHEAVGSISQEAAADTLAYRLPSGLMLQDPEIVAIKTTALDEAQSSCSNCLIRRCRVSGNKLTGYCLTGARGGICHQAYDPTNCTSGKLAVSIVLKQCGPSTLAVDNSRPCQ